MTRKQPAEVRFRRFPTKASPLWVVFLPVVCAATIFTHEASAAQSLPADVFVDIGALPPGKTVTIEFDTTVKKPFPAFVNEVSNQGIITGASIAALVTDDPGTPVAHDPTVTGITAAPDLVITKDDDGGTHAPGDTIRYTLSYFNIGDQDGADALITETVPANTKFDAGASTAGWACVPDGNPGSTCTLAIGEVAGGGGGSVAYAVLVDDPVPPGTQLIANTVTIAGAQPDPNPANNNATEITILGEKIPDIDGDGAVTGADLLILMREYHTTSGRSDLDNDSWVDWEDLWILGGKWGAQETN